SVEIGHGQRMREPVFIVLTTHANIGHANECAYGTMKDFAPRQIFYRSSFTIHVQVKVEDLFPHCRKKDQVPLLPGVLLRDLQLDAFVSLLQPAKKRRHRFACLKIDGTVLDLDDDVVVKLSVKRME